MSKIIFSNIVNELSFDPSTVAGVILYVDTLDIDEKLRYIIIDNTIQLANSTEHKLITLLPMR